jgi:hypothetical protein
MISKLPAGGAGGSTAAAAAAGAGAGPGAGGAALGGFHSVAVGLNTNSLAFGFIMIAESRNMRYFKALHLPYSVCEQIMCFSSECINK